MIAAFLVLGCVPPADAAPPPGITPEQDGEIKRILRIFADGAEEQGLLGLCRQLLAIFAAVGWLRKRFLPCDAVGVHPVNRDGLGVIAQDCYDLGGDILDAAWDDQECASAICIEAKSDNPHILSFTRKAVRESNGRLPAVDERVLQYGALSCNHTLCFLRCVAHAMRASEPELEKICHQGRLSVELLQTVDGLFARRVTEGMQWDVLDWRVEFHYGDQALQLISEARNMGAQLARRENVFQVIRRIYLLSARNPQSPDWADISRKVLRSKPPCGPYLSKLVPWVVRCAGTEGWALDWMLRLVRANSLGSAGREIEPEFWEACALAPACPETPALKAAILLTNLTAPACTVRNGRCKLLGTSDLAIFKKQGKQAAIQECEGFLKTCIQFMGKLDAWQIQQEAAAQVASAAPVAQEQEGESAEFCALRGARRTVAWLLDKKEVAAGESLLSLGGLGFEFKEALRKRCGEVDSLSVGIEAMASWRKETPKDEDNKGKPGKSGEEDVRVPLVQSALSGGVRDVWDTLRGKGFQIHTAVVRKDGSGQVWEIASLKPVGHGEDLVVLKNLEESEAPLDPVTLDDFLQTWVQAETGYENKHLRKWPLLGERRAEESVAWQVALAQAHIQTGLQALGKEWPDKTAPVRLMVNLLYASKGLQADAAIPAKQLVLVPLTSSIRAREASQKKDDEADPSQYQCAFRDGCRLGQEWQFFLLKPTFQDKKSTDKPKDGQKEEDGGGGQKEEDKGDAEEEAEATSKEKDAKTDMVALFWKVKPVPKEDEANMQAELVTASVLTHISHVAPFFTHARKKVAGKSNNAELGAAQASVIDSSAVSVSVEIPVLVNHKPLKEGDWLTVYKKEEEGTKDRDKRIDPKRLLEKNVAASKSKRTRYRRDLPGL